MTREQILNRVKEHYDYLTSLGYDVVCTCLQGSQNYGLDEYSEEYWSDIDTKSIVLPPLDDFINATSPISEVIVLENNEHAEIKDIRVMFEMFKKMNISYIELLYSDYIIFNPTWKDYILPLWRHRGSISAYNKNQFIRCIVGMAGEKRKALCHPYPNIKSKIDKYGYDGKQLHHCARLYEFLLRYQMGYPLPLCYKSKNRELLMHYKKQEDAEGGLLAVEDAINLCDAYLRNIKQIRENMIKADDVLNPEVEKLLKRVKFTILKEKMRRELND